MNIQEQINQAQFPIAVKASAGTGKTYCLVEKIKYCIENGINPYNILTFTFTVDASNELKTRIPKSELMTVGTIHSVMLQVIKDNSKKRYYVIDAKQQNSFFFDIFKDLKIDFDNYTEYQLLVGLAKNTFPDYYDLLESNDDKLEEFFDNDMKLIEFAKEYEAKKEHCHKIDFDDFVLKAYKILKENPEILDMRQERWKYIFVDEAQDLCPPQIELIRLLGDKYKNLFIVGDEKQCIYFFRASNPIYLKRFKDFYPNATIFSLPTTYRCSKLITDAGNKIASIIDESVIDTVNQNDGVIVKNLEFNTQREEAKELCRLAIKDFNNGKSVKILYRTNAQSLVYQLLLLNLNMPFSINQVNSIFTTKEVKLAISCCELVMAYKNLSVYAKAGVLSGIRPLIFNKNGLYLLTKKMKDVGKCPFENPAYFAEDKIMDVIDELNRIISSLKKLDSISAIFNFVAELIEGRKSFSSSAYDNLIGVSEFVSECKSLKELNELIELMSRPRILKDGERAISLSTIHGSKGLESDTVFVTGVCDGLFPHKFGDEKEELNLFYVACTRAKINLYITGFKSFGRNSYILHSYSELI